MKYVQYEEVKTLRRERTIETFFFFFKRLIRPPPTHPLTLLSCSLAFHQTNVFIPNTPPMMEVPLPMAVRSESTPCIANYIHNPW